MKYEMVICPKCNGHGKIKIKKDHPKNEYAHALFIYGKKVSESEWINYK